MTDWMSEAEGRTISDSLLPVTPGLPVKNKMYLNDNSRISFDLKFSESEGGSLTSGCFCGPAEIH